MACRLKRFLLRRSRGPGSIRSQDDPREQPLNRLLALARKRKTNARSARREGLEVAESTVRIIGGTMRGRLLKYSGDPRTRPMKDRVREAVFNLIGPSIKHSHAIDLFAGTGALGLEALSRGARRATLIERHFPSAKLISENARTLGVTDRVEVVTGDTFVWLKQSVGGLGETTPWTIFCSPPYDFYVDQYGQMIELVSTCQSHAPPETCLIVECDSRFDTGQLPGCSPWQVRAYPPAVLCIWRKSQAMQAS